jgi:zinc protease
MLFVNLNFIYPSALASDTDKYEFFPELHSKTLTNGMKCITTSIPTKGIVAVNIRINTGSTNEGEYLGTGITHLSEHMIFKGSKNYSQEELLKKIKSIGGIINATTSLDTTSFYITLPANHLKKALLILKEMVFQQEFDKSDFEKEKSVIKKEMLLNQDRPSRKLHKLIWKTVYQQHPYRHPIIGYPKLFDALKIKDLIWYYQEKYTPNNTVIAVAGDINPEKTLDILKDIFANIEKSAYKPVFNFKQTHQVKSRYSGAKGNIELARLAIAYKSTKAVSQDTPALDLLAVILGQSTNSRLYKKIVKKQQLARSVNSFNYTPRDNGIFNIQVVLEPERLNKAKEIILKEIKNLQASPPSTEELKKAKKQIISNYFFSLESPRKLANRITLSEAITHEPEFDKVYIRKIEKVTSEDIKNAAKKYLLKAKANIIELIPVNYQTKNKNINKNKTVNLKRNNYSQKVKLANGIIIVATKMPYSNSIAVSVTFPGGVRQENKKNNGITLFTARMLLKGTANRDESQIKPLIEAQGGKINSFAKKDSFGLQIKVLREDLKLALDILADIIANSNFPEEEIAKERKKILLDLRLENEDIFTTARQYLEKALYKNHPYQMNKLGSVRALQNLNREDLTSYYQKNCKTKGTIISIAGDIDSGETINKVKKMFSSLTTSANNSYPYTHQKVTPLLESKEIQVPLEKKEIVVMRGYPTINFFHKDRYGLEILGSIMSGYNGRLFYAIRDFAGLSYTQGVFKKTPFDAGYIGFYIATSPKNQDKVTALLEKEIKNLVDNGISLEELKDAKTQLISNYRRNLLKNNWLAAKAANYSLYQIPNETIFAYENEIKILTQKDINAIINRYLKNKNSVLITVGPAD